jgi:methionine sulfoxide reductase heme-binding subunit
VENPPPFAFISVYQRFLLLTQIMRKVVASAAAQPNEPSSTRAAAGPAGSGIQKAVTQSFLARLLRRKVVIWTLIILPGFWPAWPFFVEKDPTALTDPLKFLLHHLGFIACLLLVGVLTLTPLRVLFPKWDVTAALNRHRRLIGVSAFAYALLHFAVHVFYQYDGTYDGTMTQLGKELQKPFQLTGLVALTILFVLTVTSVNVAVRWLGRKWKKLHRLAYVAAALVAYHQATAQKTFPPQVVWIFAPLVLLEVARFVKQRQRLAHA